VSTFLAARWAVTRNPGDEVVGVGEHGKRHALDGASLPEPTDALATDGATVPERRDAVRRRARRRSRKVATLAMHRCDRHIEDRVPRLGEFT